MRRRRFIVDKQLLERQGLVTLGPRESRHVQKVLRLSPGATIELCDGDGRTCEATILRLEPERVVVALAAARPEAAARAPTRLPRLTLIYGLSRKDRTEWVLQKATELGVDCLVLAECQRSVSRPSDRASKEARWREIIKSAAQQAGRGALPELAAVMPFATAIVAADPTSLGLIAAPGGRSIQQAIRADARLTEVRIVIGPEGGFDPSELELAEQQGLVRVGLGEYTLRTETAAVAALAVLNLILGRM